MDREEFWHILKTEFGYQSPPRTCFLAKNFPGWATVVFYAKILKLVAVNSVIARLGRFDRRQWANSSVAAIKIVESVGGRLHVSGLRGVTEHTGPLVYIANHMSMLDTFLLPCLTLAFNDVTFVVKKGLLRYPVFGPIMRAIHPIAVTRDSPRADLKKVLSKGQNVISKDSSIVIFPQATRNAVFDLASFNSLGVKLAQRTGVPVVPVALKTDFQGNGRIIRDLGHINPKKNLYIKFGAPLSVEGSGPTTHRKIMGFIASSLREWGCEIQGGERSRTTDEMLKA